MARTDQLSQRELKRVAAAAYEGKAIRVMLCDAGVTGYNAETTVANWQSVEVSGNGYSRFSGTVGTGSYDAGEAAYLMPYIDAPFTATAGGGGISFDSVVTYFQGETYVHSVITESPNEVIPPGKTLTYRRTLGTDD